MKKIILIIIITIVIVFSVILSSCQTGVSQALYDQVAAQVKEAQSRLADVQKALSDLQAQKSVIDKELNAAKTTITDLQKQVGALKDQATLIGATPADTAAKIVKYYHDTHVYSAYDLFVCSDMSSEVWNMLKAQNISAVVVVGNVDTAITDILQSDHAWVLATVAPGNYLALETTGGYVVKKSEHPLYYRGWAFSSPADLKSHNDMVKEYNIRVGFRNQINTEANKVAALYNASTNPTDAAKYKAVYDKLVELRTAQETTLNNLMGSINKLATAISY
jgi:outer membrane murein-binding lipoprotein Lpp